MKHKTILCEHCGKPMPLYEINCNECHHFTKQMVPTPPNDGSAFYWRHLADKIHLQSRDKNNRPLTEEQHYHLAIEAYSKVIEIEPTPKDYFNRGFLSACIKNFPQGIKDLKIANSMEPKSFGGIGFIHMMKSEFEFYKKQEKIKPFIHKLLAEKKIKSKEMRKNSMGDRIYSFTDKRGNKIKFNITQDTLKSFNGEEWL